MKSANTMKQFLFLLACCPLFFACRQISKTVEETFHPNDSIPAPARRTHPPVTDSQTIVSSSVITESHTSTHIHEHREGDNKRFLADDAGLNAAETALVNLPQYAGKRIFLYTSVHFYDDGSIHTQLQHPDNPGYIDAYEYRNGAWSAPKPQQVSIKDNIESRLVPLKKVRFANAAKVARACNEKAAQVAGAKPVTYVYVTIWNNEVRWYPTTIHGTRERYAIRFDADGNLLTFGRE